MIRALLTGALLAVATGALAGEAPDAFVARAIADAAAAIEADGSLVRPGTIGLYFDADLARAMLEAEYLDADPILNAQDATDITAIESRVVGKDGDFVRVDARWSNGGEEQMSVFVLTETGDGWRIHDIEYVMVTPQTFLFQVDPE